MKIKILTLAALSVALIGGYAHLSTEHCGLVFDKERRSVLNTMTSNIIKELGLQRSVNSTDVCHMPVSKIERAVYRVNMPKPDHPGEAAAFRYQSLLNEHGELNASMVVKAKEHVDAMKRLAPFDAGINRESWEELGPGNIGGRIRTFVFDPSDPNRMIAGSVSGGLWETTTAGTEWKPVDDFMANLAITTLTYDPSDNQVMYAGTGEGFFNGDAIRGLGIFKSSDNGATWTSLKSTSDSENFHFVNRLAIASDGTAMYSATGRGIWKSTDDGENWQEIHSGFDYVFDSGSEESEFAFARVLDLDVAPNNDKHIIASTHGAPLYSEDGGDNWQVSAPFPFVSETQEAGKTVKSINRVRFESAFSKSDPNIVYTSVENNNGELYRSSDGGKNFTLVNSGAGYLGSQGWYDNALWVDPLDPNHVIVGGIDLWRSTDGGENFNKISTWWASPFSAHADHHVIMQHPNYDGQTNKRVFFGNDGGMYTATDLDAIIENPFENTFTGWTALNNNLGITQFYGMGVAPDGTIIAGTQDNGTLVLKPDTDNESWYETFGGDGGYSTADPTDSNYLYGEYVYLQIHRSSNGGKLWPEPGFSDYIHDSAMEDGALFIAPFILDHNNPNRMLAGSNKLWVSDNVKDPAPTWSIIKPEISGSTAIKSIAVATGNSDMILVGYTSGEIYKTVDGTELFPQWTRIDSENMPSRSNFRLAIDPKDHDTIYASFSGYADDNFWRSDDAGLTWVEATGQGLEGLPPAPIRGIAVHPTKTNRLYVGTELGVFTSEDKGNSWSISNDGPANVAVDELIWQNDTTLLAATHGRGIFRATITEDATPEPISFERTYEVAISSVQQSNPALITGLTIKTEVSIANGEFATNCDADTPTFTSEAKKVSNGAYICVRHTSSENTNTETTTTLTVGTLSADFVSKTVIDRTPNAITFSSISGAALSSVQTSPSVTVSGIDVPVNISISGGEYAKGCDANNFTTTASTIASGETFCVRHTSSASYSSSVTTNVNVGDTTANFSSTTEVEPPSSGGGSLFWLLPLTLIGLKRRY